jgi:vacuolar-type H+-ATPase subunit E/Vma4
MKPLQVAIALNIRQSYAAKYYREYWKLRGLHKLNAIYIKTNGKIWPFLKLYKELIKKRDMSIEQIVNVVEIAIYKLPYMESLYEQVKDEADKMQRTIQRLANDMHTLERRISLLDKAALSSVQERKRTERRVHELIAQKDRIEKWIMNVLNGEDYSNLKAFIKENVKAILSDKRILISVSFAAIIQTLKDDPQMIKLIQNIAAANNGEQHKDNHINITQYFESNKDRILNLGEKNYENLVQALTNNAIDIAASASSSSTNPTLSLPQSSSSMFPNLSTQSDTYKIEDPESFHNSKGDIAD